jgi:hypothetical protein
MTAPSSQSPVDDLTIANAADLWRRIFPRWWILDEDSGTRRLSSQAFEDSKDKSPMSVTIAAECAGQALVLAKYPGYGLAVFTAGQARLCGQILQRNPTADDPAHAHVIGKKNKTAKDCLRSAAALLVSPTA